MVFLGEGFPQKRKAPVITIDFSKETDAQDMLSKIMKKKKAAPAAEDAAVAAIAEAVEEATATEEVTAEVAEETQEEIVLEVIKDPALGKTIDISG